MSMTMMGVEDAQGVATSYPTANLQLLIRSDMGLVKAGGGSPADGDLIQTWQDQSGNSRDVAFAVGHRPAYKVSQTPNSSPAIRFDGTTTYGIFTGFTLTAATVYAVLKPNSVGALAEVSIISGDLASFYWRIDVSTGKAQLVKARQALIATASSAYALGSWAQGNISSDNTSTVIFRKNSAADATVSAAASIGGVNVTTIGTDDSGTAGNEFMYQDLACVMAYNTVHSLATKQQVEAWLTSTFGV